MKERKGSRVKRFLENFVSFILLVSYGNDLKENINFCSSKMKKYKVIKEKNILWKEILFIFAFCFYQKIKKLIMNLAIIQFNL